MSVGPRIEIEYCRRCRFLMRATWVAQELLSTFEAEIGEIVLRPSGGGIFEVSADGEAVATNRDGAPMPDVRDIKRAVRDRIAPGRTLGHEPKEG
jgi:selenoprotein W-related protein